MASDNKCKSCFNSVLPTDQVCSDCGIRVNQPDIATAILPGFQKLKNKIKEFIPFTRPVLPSDETLEISPIIRELNMEKFYPKKTELDRRCENSEETFFVVFCTN